MDAATFAILFATRDIQPVLARHCRSVESAFVSKSAGANVYVFVTGIHVAHTDCGCRADDGLGCCPTYVSVCELGGFRGLMSSLKGVEEETRGINPKLESVGFDDRECVDM